MAYNLSRNSRVFVTTNLSTGAGQGTVITAAGSGTSSAAGQVFTTGFNTTNTFELQVLDGFKFSQATSTANIQIKEAGNTPIRGQRAFNTALNPVDISFSTYIRPRKPSGTAGTAFTLGNTTAEERVLWNALLGSVAVSKCSDPNGTAGGAVISATTITGATGFTRATTAASAITLAGTAMSGLPVVNDIVYIKQASVAANMIGWNGPAQVVSASATSIVFNYLDTPIVSAGTANASPVTVTWERAAWVENASVTGGTSYAEVTSATSNKNQLQAIAFIFVVDNSTYVIENCAIDQVQVDFGLDAIATAAWTAKGTKLIQLAGASIATVSSDTNAGLDNATVVFGATNLAGTAQGKVTSANYITNKLSTLQVKSLLGNIGDTLGSDKTYSLVLTAGNITIANNITYVTPTNMGVVNTPIGYFTGTRAISGTLNAYLKTGTNEASTLLTDVLSAAGTSAETKFRIQVELGGGANGTRLELEMPGVMLGVPSVDVADVISTAITFNAQGTSNTTATSYDIANTNDISIRYFSA